jgi:two-component system response regulator AtoC
MVNDVQHIGNWHLCSLDPGFMFRDLTHSSRIEASDLPGETVIFGSSEAMCRVRQQVDLALRSGLPVLIRGESGTGKELVAKYLHVYSGQTDRAFVKINCAALTKSPLDSEIPGCDDAGTLFLDEIGDLDRNLLEVLLNSLSNQCAAGSEGMAKTPDAARIICSTRIDCAANEEGADPELNDRKRLIHLKLSALRDRKQDIPQLCEFFMQRQARRFGKDAHHLAADTLELLTKWQWPGNLRELENWIARVVILGNQQMLVEELRNLIALEVIADEIYRPEDKSGLELCSPATSGTWHTQDWLARKRASGLTRESYRSLFRRLRDANSQIPRRRPSHHRELPPTQ